MIGRQVAVNHLVHAGMLPWLRLLVFVSIVVFISGCMVVSENPVGSEVLRSKGKGWSGTWVGANEVYYIDARDSQEGEIEIFAVSGNSKYNFEMKSATGLLRKGVDKVFLNLKMVDVSQRKIDPLLNDYWFPFIVEKEGDVVRLYIPDFNRLIKEEMEGVRLFEKVDSHYLLKGTSEEIAEALVNEMPLALFDELTRLPDRLESIGVKETSDLTKYESLISDPDTSGVEHFPKSIENDPSRYKLSHQPGFLQGGGHFHLEEKMTQEKALELHGRMMDEAIAYKDVGTSTPISLKEEVDINVPGISNHTSDTDYSLPKGFRIFYIHAKPYKDDGFKWNHGSTTGIGINKDDGRVIYFVENW